MSAQTFDSRFWIRSMARGKPRHRHDDLEREAVLRHLGGRAGPLPDPPFGGGRGRKRRGDVRSAVLRLLAEEPRNGYQLMQEIEERSGGRWRPSPGSVYPTLQQLEDEGLIQPFERDGTKLFELTNAGREQVSAAGSEVAPWDDEDAPEGLMDLKSQIKQIHIAAMQVLHAGSRDQVKRASKALADTRKAMYRILAEDEEPDA
jgi:DNA-binding PadR family transcriptional regulator